MDINKDLCNLVPNSSLVRTFFQGKNIKARANFIELPGQGTKIPSYFSDYSFYPKGELDLAKVSQKVIKILNPLTPDRDYIKRTSPGVCEIIKNAYEHGNKEDGSKKITFASKISNQGVEFLVGDEGSSLTLDFLPYVLLMRQKGHGKFYENVPDFYMFREKLFAPQGHSGVGTKTAHVCFDQVNYYKNNPQGLLVHLRKKLPKN